jgi:hypothetical protein
MSYWLMKSVNQAMLINPKSDDPPTGRRFYAQHTRVRVFLNPVSCIGSCCDVVRAFLTRQKNEYDVTMRSLAKTRLPP